MIKISTRSFLFFCLLNREKEKKSLMHKRKKFVFEFILMSLGFDRRSRNVVNSWMMNTLTWNWIECIRTERFSSFSICSKWIHLIFDLRKKMPLTQVQWRSISFIDLHLQISTFSTMVLDRQEFSLVEATRPWCDNFLWRHSKIEQNIGLESSVTDCLCPLTAASARSFFKATCLFFIVSNQSSRKRFCKTSAMGVDGLDKNRFHSTVSITIHNDFIEKLTDREFQKPYRLWIFVYYFRLKHHEWRLSSWYRARCW